MTAALTTKHYLPETCAAKHKNSQQTTATKTTTKQYTTHCKLQI